MSQPKVTKPNTLLRQAREKLGRSQQRIAGAVGVTQNTYARWERGETYPDLYWLKRLCEVLDKSAEELGFTQEGNRRRRIQKSEQKPQDQVDTVSEESEEQQEGSELLTSPLENSLVLQTQETSFDATSILPFQNIPISNPYFTGREEILRRLHAEMSADKHVALIQAQAISGLGGMGKTQVAIEYAYRYHDHYRDILWVAADSRETLITSYLILAQHLRLREREEHDQHKIIEAVKHWLREHKNWLLIFDNIEDVELVREFVPAPRQGAILLTTRREETRPIANPLRVEAMSEEEGILFLLRRAGRLSNKATVETASAIDREAARSLTQDMGGLPLALDQAGAYVAETKRSLPDYLDLLEQQQIVLLDRRGTLSPDHRLSVTATFLLAFEQAQQKSQVAIDLLKLCAFLVPDAIPLEVITKGVAHSGKVLEQVANDALQLDQALEILQAYSLVRYDGISRTLSIHRLVQAVLQGKMEEVERRLWAEQAMLAVNAVFPHSEHNTWRQCERLLPQVLKVTQLIEQYHIFVEEGGRLLHETATYLRDHARYAEAEPLYKYAQRILEQLETQHFKVAYPLHGLAILYREQGKYKDAKLFYQRALRIWEQELGLRHPNIAYSFMGLAILSYEQGKYAQAERLYRRALRIWERGLEPRHPNIAYPLTGLANVYRKQGKYAQAEKLYRRALWIWEQGLEPQHSNIAHPLTDLANVYRKQGKYADAELRNRQTKGIEEHESKLKHPDAASPLTGLANLYHEQGKYAEAEPLYRQALRIREQELGPQHPETAETLYDLARLHAAQGNKGEAKNEYTRALTIYEQTLEEYHPKTTEIREHFIALLHKMELHKEAAQLEVDCSGPSATEK